MPDNSSLIIKEWGEGILIGSLIAAVTTCWLTLTAVHWVCKHGYI